ncbi:C4-dicarboxylate transport sensor protein [hydrothermal vent metagenome]|uniref:histidine kinase n=1 Tax=hydrothermal vent metagenome TaxID=652676 RepID=A0A3B0S4V5_9ZZZZ
MTGETRSKLMVITAFLLIVAALAAGIWRYGYGQALGQLEKQGRADLALATDRFTGQLRRYQELAVLMAEHPALASLNAGGDAAAANRLLLEAADKTGALALIYTDAKGEVLARAGDAPENLRQSGYFRRALTGALGAEHGLYGAQNTRAYVYAAPAFGPTGTVTGVLIVMVDVAELEWDWIGGQPAVFFTTSEGDVFLSNRSELLFWQSGAGGVGLQPRAGPMPDFRASNVGGYEIWRMNWGAYLPRRALHLKQPIPVIGMVGHAVINVNPASQLAGLQASVFALICLIFGAFLFLTAERRRTLARANAMLETRVAERTAELSGTNRALKQAQADLVQAGKLSALGQMSAGISHELNQPLMAIRQYADNGAAYLEKDKPGAVAENLLRISQLAVRAARIIKNLRAFSRNENEPMGKVDLVQVINTAAELTEARLRTENIALNWVPGKPVFAWGGEVRLGQVFVNLINNAADAMAGQDGEKRIDIAVNAKQKLTVTVRDTGPGIADPDRMFEPFYSTKEVSNDEGMGLGLSISYGLVQSFGGNIRGANVGGGAMFTVELEYFQAEVAA